MLFLGPCWYYRSFLHDMDFVLWTSFNLFLVSSLCLLDFKELEWKVQELAINDGYANAVKKWKMNCKGSCCKHSIDCYTAVIFFPFSPWPVILAGQEPYACLPLEDRARQRQQDMTDIGLLLHRYRVNTKK